RPAAEAGAAATLDRGLGRLAGTLRRLVPDRSPAARLAERSPRHPPGGDDARVCPAFLPLAAPALSLYDLRLHRGLPAVPALSGYRPGAAAADRLQPLPFRCEVPRIRGAWGR